MKLRSIFLALAARRAAQPLTAEDRNPCEGYMRDETDAECQLQGHWSGAVLAQRETCVAEARTSGAPSYVDMLPACKSPMAPPPRLRALPAAAARMQWT